MPISNISVTELIDPEIVLEVKEVLEKSNKKDILSFAKSLTDYSKYWDVYNSTEAEQQSELLYSTSVIEAFKQISPEAEELERQCLWFS